MPGKKKKKVSKKSAQKADLKDLHATEKRIYNIPSEEIEIPGGPMPVKRDFEEVMRDVQKNRRDNFLSTLQGSDTNQEEMMSFGILSKKVRDEFSHQEIKDLKMVFDLFDNGSTGRVSFDELERLLKFLRFNIRDQDLRVIVNDLDTESSGQYGLNEFLLCISSQEVARDKHIELQQAFKKFDLRTNDCITVQELRYINKKQGMGLSEQELEEMILMADKNGNGSVDQSEFVDVMMKTNLFIS